MAKLVHKMTLKKKFKKLKKNLKAENMFAQWKRNYYYGHIKANSDKLATTL